MKISSENNNFVIRECYSGVLFISDDKEELGICMRDSGFEFTYGNMWYEAKNGKLCATGVITENKDKQKKHNNETS